MAVGLVLMAMQWLQRSKIGSDWIHSSSRFYRRILIGFVFLLWGVMIACIEGISFIGRPMIFMCYIGCLGMLGLLAVILALADAVETMRAASGALDNTLEPSDRKLRDELMKLLAQKDAGAGPDNEQVKTVKSEK